MITILLLGGIVAGLGLLANRPAASSPAVANSTPPIGSAVSPTPSTPTPASHTIFTDDQESLYAAALAARAQSGIPIVAGPQTRAVPQYASPVPVAPRIVAPVRPAPARAPIAQVGTGGVRTASRTKLSLF